MNLRNLALEVEALLTVAKTRITQGDTAVAIEFITLATEKIRPIGSGTNGPDPQE